MRGGEIRENVANLDGGGVHVYGRARDVADGQSLAALEGASFRMEGGVIRGNTATYTGGGVIVRHGEKTGEKNVTFTMMNGTITGNFVEQKGSSLNSMTGDGGGGVYVANDAFFKMYAGEISENWTSGRIGGGGLLVSQGGDATIEGGEIRRNESIKTTRAPGLGGGILAMANGSVSLRGGEISENRAELGGGVHVEWTSTLTMDAAASETGVVIRQNGLDLTGAVQTKAGGGVSIGRGGTVTMRAGEISGNQVLGTGGGVQINPSQRHTLNNAGGTATLTLNEGDISGNNAGTNGGGVHMEGSAVFAMTSGAIRQNSANDGGGLFVLHSNLNNLSIAQAGVFSDNVARNGLRIDGNLATTHRARINPDTVSITGQSVIDEMPAGSGTFAELTPHAFTNFDINATGPYFWRVTYAVEDGAGDIAAEVGLNRFPVANGAFLRDGAALTFGAGPAEQFDRWQVGTRPNEIAADGSATAFSFHDGGSDPQLRHTVTMHTHVIGHFLAGFTITFDPNDGQSAPFVQWVPGGEYILSHEATHAGIDGQAFEFVGWNTAADGSGVPFAIGEHLDITESIILYAQWRLATRTLLLSKDVIGPFGDRSMEFHFTLFLQCPNGRPLLEGRQFSYVGDIIEGSHALAPADGILTLDGAGSASVRLTHGQAIRIEDIPLGGYIQVIETADANYVTSFIDSESADGIVHQNGTEMLHMMTDRTLCFTNERIVVPPTGTDIGNMGAILLLPVLVLSSASVMFVCNMGHRYRKTVRHK